MTASEETAKTAECLVPGQESWRTLFLECPVCGSDTAETLGVAGSEHDAAVVMSCAACESVYLSPPRSSPDAASAADPRPPPTARQLRHWTRGLRPDARAARVGAPGALPAAGEFELIVLDRALERASQPGEFLRAAARLLSPNGRILVVADNARSSCFAAFGGRHWQGYAAAGTRQQLTPASFDHLGAAAGLRVTHVKTRFAASAWLESTRAWLLDWGAGRGLVAVLTGRWLVPSAIAGVLESLALLRGRGAIVVAELVRA